MYSDVYVPVKLVVQWTFVQPPVKLYSSVVKKYMVLLLPWIFEHNQNHGNTISSSFLHHNVQYGTSLIKEVLNVKQIANLYNSNWNRTHEFTDVFLRDIFHIASLLVQVDMGSTRPYPSEHVWFGSGSYQMLLGGWCNENLVRWSIIAPQPMKIYITQPEFLLLVILHR